MLSQALGLAPYDALIDEFSPGFLSAEIDQLFRVVSRRLPNLIREAIELQAAQPALPLLGKVGASKQRTLAIEVMRALGFPFDRGRLDESDHPFTEGVNGDVRVTTRFDLKDPFTGLMGVLHETGQAMYDLGLPEAWRDQPVGRDRGMALEESQSLLLEMVIGRSRPFLKYLRPLLDKHFGVTGPGVGGREPLPDADPRAAWRHPRGCRRAHVPGAHHAALRAREADLRRHAAGAGPARGVARGTRPPARPAPGQRRRGCLQDHHWAVGWFGYFPSYALGGFIAAQLYETLRNDHPDLDREIEAGRFGSLFEWLRQNVHSHGASLSSQELIKKATGKALTAAPWLRYAEGKYLEESGHDRARDGHPAGALAARQGLVAAISGRFTNGSAT